MGLLPCPGGFGAEPGVEPWSLTPELFSTLSLSHNIILLPNLIFKVKTIIAHALWEDLAAFYSCD